MKFALIGPVVSEEKTFEECGRQNLPILYAISSSNGSGELMIIRRRIEKQLFTKHALQTQVIIYNHILARSDQELYYTSLSSSVPNPSRSGH